MRKGVPMTKRILLLLPILACSILLLCGCGDGDDNGTKITAEQLTNQGWGKFTAGDYTGASLDFKAANGLDPTYEAAYLGLGWAELKKSSAGLAESAFKTYLQKTSNSEGITATIAGLALAYHAQDKFQDAIDQAEDLLTSSPNWEFSRDASTNHLDIALVMAQSYYEIGEFQSSLDVVRQYFDAGFSVDLTTDDGRKQLADKLESLYTG
jgi:outer membrane protein assembly factor BamD (BamD/ComL family)